MTMADTIASVSGFVPKTAMVVIKYPNIKIAIISSCQNQTVDWQVCDEKADINNRLTLPLSD